MTFGSLVIKTLRTAYYRCGVPNDVYKLFITSGDLHMINIFAISHNLEFAFFLAAVHCSLISSTQSTVINDYSKAFSRFTLQNS